MSQSINLPDNATSFHRLAQQQLSQGRYEAAFHLLEKSYQLEANPDVFEEMIYLLLHYLPTNTLKQVWQTHLKVHSLDEIYQNPQYLKLYVQSLPHLKPQHEALLDLYRIQAHQQAKDWSHQPTYELIQQIEAQMKQQSDLLHALEFNQGDSYLENLLKQGQFHLLHILKSYYLLPLEQTEAFYLLILASPTVFHYIKADILHYLLGQNYHKEVPYLFMEQTLSLSIGDLQPYQEYKSYQWLIQHVYHYCEQENPHLLEALLTQIQLYYLSFYPYFDKLFQSTEEWFQVFLAITLGDELVNKAPKTSQILSDIEQIQVELTTLLSHTY